MASTEVDVDQSLDGTLHPTHLDELWVGLPVLETEQRWLPPYEYSVARVERRTIVLAGAGTFAALSTGSFRTLAGCAVVRGRIRSFVFRSSSVARGIGGVGHRAAGHVIHGFLHSRFTGLFEAFPPRG